MKTPKEHNHPTFKEVMQCRECVTDAAKKGIEAQKETEVCKTCGRASKTVALEKWCPFCKKNTKEVIEAQKETNSPDSEHSDKEANHNNINNESMKARTRCTKRNRLSTVVDMDKCPFCNKNTIGSTVEEILVAIRKFVEHRTGYIEPSSEYILSALVKQALTCVRDEARTEAVLKGERRRIIEQIRAEERKELVEWLREAIHNARGKTADQELARLLRYIQSK